VSIFFSLDTATVAIDLSSSSAHIVLERAQSGV
jgi:hypothetical protein